MKPESVRRARQREDSAALSAMGRKGAKVTNEKRDLKSAIDKEYRQRRLDETQAMAKERGDELILEDDR